MINDSIIQVLTSDIGKKLQCQNIWAFAGLYLSKTVAPESLRQ
jgi:hypothetical protein